MIEGSNTTARGRLVWLRAFGEDDLEPYERAVNDRRVGHRAGYRFPQGRDQVRAWYEKRVKSPGHDRYYVISPLGDRAFAGTIWLWNHDSRLGGPELSMFVSDPGTWGKGYGSDAIDVAVDLAYGSGDLHRMWLITAADNERAQKVFLRSGFQVEGTLRRHHWDRGSLVDAILMSLVREDWEELARPKIWDLDA